VVSLHCSSPPDHLIGWRVKPTGVIQLTSPGFNALAESFAAAAAKHQLP